MTSIKIFHLRMQIKEYLVRFQLTSYYGVATMPDEVRKSEYQRLDSSILFEKIESQAFGGAMQKLNCA